MSSSTADTARTGSPPLVRERQRLQYALKQCSGITPARAGKTHQFCQPNRAVEDHPRSCGKDYISISTSWTAAGSPPLVRERHKNAGDRNGRKGITPARAGKTTSNNYLSNSMQDHPRSCGKDWHQESESAPLQGSPPLVRERLTPCYDSKRYVGITPARAGKTTRYPTA